MSEYFDIRDWDGNRTGEMKEREQVHRDGDIHGTAHVWVIRSSKETGRPEVLLQKRSEKKDIFPGCFDVSAAGHLDAGEDFPEAAVRELKEELGLEVKPEELERLFLNQETVRRTFHGKKVYDRDGHGKVPGTDGRQKRTVLRPSRRIYKNYGLRGQDAAA